MKELPTPQNYSLHPDRQKVNAIESYLRSIAVDLSSMSYLIKCLEQSKSSSQATSQATFNSLWSLQTHRETIFACFGYIVASLNYRNKLTSVAIEECMEILKQELAKDSDL